MLFRSTHCLREDIQNADLLLLGTEFAVWASLDRGSSWTKLNNNLPTVAVHDFAFHPTSGEVVAATHGRSVWILDVTALRQMTAEALKAPAGLYRPNTVVRWRTEPQRGSMYGVGSRLFVGENPPPEAQILYSLTKKADKASIKILDYTGKTLRELPAKTEPGLHRAKWDFTGISTRQGGPGGPGGGGPGGPGGQRGRLIERLTPVIGATGIGVLGAYQGRGPQVRAVPGMYRVVLTVDGKEYAQGLRIEADPTLPPPAIAVEEEILPEEQPKRDKRKVDD